MLSSTANCLLHRKNEGGGNGSQESWTKNSESLSEEIEKKKGEHLRKEFKM